MIMLRSSTRSEILLRRRGYEGRKYGCARKPKPGKQDTERDLTKIQRILVLGCLKNQPARASNTNI